MKFIKLTRFDNKPVWLNAGFIVTVEPRREGVGAVVVPIGDGLDYDVRESPDDILKMLADEPAPTVVPVPIVDDGLAPTPKDVSPEPAPRASEPSAPSAESKAEPAEAPKKPRRRTAKAKAEGEPAEKPAKKPAARKTVKKPVALELSDDQIARLAKLSPKSVDKLRNTLLTQFHIADVVATIQGLEEKGVFTRDGKHVIWKA